MFRFPHSLLLLASSVALSLSVAQPAVEDTRAQHVNELNHWFEGKGGFIDPRVEIRRWDSNDPTSYYGVFVNAPVQQNELLVRIPGEIKIQIDEDTSDWDDNETICELAWLLKEEYEKNEDSEYLPYINYLKSQSFGQIPAAWSPSGQHLLNHVQGQLNLTFDDKVTQPEEITSWIQKTFTDECFVNETRTATGSLNPFYIAMVTQRGFERALIPIYDMLNHYNGGKINTVTDASIFDEDGFGMLALRDLEVGEELFYSYDGCPEYCDLVDRWGTPEILRDFGFVEGYPHRFHLWNNTTITVEEIVKSDGSVFYKAFCRDDKCPSRSWVEKTLSHLQNVSAEVKVSEWIIPPAEYATIKQYHKALSTAFEIILPDCPPTTHWNTVSASSLFSRIIG